MKKFFKLVLTFILIMFVSATSVVVSFMVKNPNNNVAQAQMDPALTEIVNVLTSTKNHKVNLKIEVDEKVIDCEISLSMAPELKANIVCNLKSFGIDYPVCITLIENSVYLKINTQKFKLKLNNFQSYIDGINKIITTIKPEMQKTVSVLTRANKLSGLEEFMENFDPNSLTKLLDYIKITKKNYGYLLTFNYEKINLKATFDSEYNLINFSTNEIYVAGSKINVSLKAKNANNINIKIDDKFSFTDIARLIELSQGAVNSVISNTYNISGPINFRLPVLGTKTFNFNAKIERFNNLINGVVLLDNLPTDFYMNNAVYSKKLKYGNIRHYVYIYLQNNDLYFERFVDYEKQFKSNGKTITLFQTEKIDSGKTDIETLSKKTENVVSSLNHILGVGKLVTDSINLIGLPTITFDFSINNILKSFDYSFDIYNYMHKLNLNIRQLTGNKDYTSFDIGIRTKNNKIDFIEIEFNKKMAMGIDKSTLTLKNNLSTYTQKIKNEIMYVNADYILNQKLTALKSGAVARNITNII